jgi:hypothetical protein
MSKAVMVDIEALGAAEKPVITQIGAAYFDKETGEVGFTFEVKIDPVDCEKYGAKCDADTVLWWLSQSREAIDAVYSGEKSKLKPALHSFYDFVYEANEIWSHAGYDFNTLQNAMKMVGHKLLCYKKERDIRTLIALSGVNWKSIPREGIHHNALDDVKYQIKYCVECLKALK